MTELSETVTRRNALKLLGSTAAAAGLTGVAAGDLTGDSMRVNVGYDTETAKQAALDLADTVHWEFAWDALTITMPTAGLDSLQGVAGIRYVERDTEVEALAQTLPWGVDRTDADVAHAAGDTGEGADIAIIDTGIDRYHGDLVDNLGEGRAFTGPIASDNWHDDNGHGTHCAGIADAVDNSQGVVGVSTTATLHAVKVLTAAGSGFNSDVAKGIEWTADQGYDVGSMSLGGGGSTQNGKEAVEYAANKGVFLIAAAGNDGPCTDCVSYPAAYPEVMAVSATNDQDQLASYSSQGPEVEIAAPGTDIYSTYTGGTYNTLSGTSMACPHVSGAAGQLMAEGQSASQARSTLKSSAEDIGLGANESGSGLLDVAAALGQNSGDDL
ncbi:S8 family peptidase [Haladaptatus sp. YSMS36]|uniref:S8 family peptidase n=1 Tax=Haladaptatus sp. YSMS36 TaxID=3033384 RepID=UPI0023E82817|nr:S8 family peptidase [Haladaptatus sp. YSMS36]